MKKLTDRQKKILDYIESFIRRNGMPPTVYEIAGYFKIKTSTAFAHLRALQRKDQLTRSSKARSISLSRHQHGTRPARGSVIVPVYCDLCGTPQESAKFKVGEIPLNRSAFSGVYDIGFALEAKDDSMRAFGIHQGDTVFAAPDKAPRPGDLVAAVIESKAVIRSCYPGDDGRVELRTSGNDAVIYDAGEVKIAGIVTLLIRKF